MAVLSVTDIAIEESNYDRYMILEGSVQASYDAKGIVISIVDPYDVSGFTHENGPNIVFS